MADTGVDWDRASLSTKHGMPAPDNGNMTVLDKNAHQSTGEELVMVPWMMQAALAQLLRQGRCNPTKTKGIGSPTGDKTGMATIHLHGDPTIIHILTQGILTMPHKRTPMLEPNTTCKHKSWQRWTHTCGICTRLRCKATCNMASPDSGYRSTKVALTLQISIC